MANITAKTSSNIFYKARCEAATHNEQLRHFRLVIQILYRHTDLEVIAVFGKDRVYQF